MKVLITGGTGFVGTALIKQLLQQKEQVVLTSRREQQPREDLQFVKLPESGELFAAELLSGLDAIVNLAGHNISAGRWTNKRKEQILNSRVQLTEQLVESIRRNQLAEQPFPKVLVNASAVGYYGTHPSRIFAEESPAGEGFLAQVCREWEAVAQRAEASGVRVVRMRLGMVLGPGSALEKMAQPYRYGLGGVIGAGKQWCPWIHREDLVQFICLALRKPSYTGVYNLCSPQPITMTEFNQQLAAVLGKKSWTRLPAWLARIVLGEMAEELLLNGQRVLPNRLLVSGFQWQYPDVRSAIKEALEQQGR